MEFKIFNDSIHGHMSLHQLLVVIMDTPQVQRLRNVRQLGACFFVYPTASHSRFEHSLGTAYVAGKLFDCLRGTHLPSDLDNEQEWEKRKLCVQVAGLCHDLGHGPFSHLWENFRKRISKEDNWTHEEESIRILDEILKEPISPTKKFKGKRLQRVRDAFEFYGLNDSDIDLIKDMIRGRKGSKSYKFQIINNKRNGIDVDKWDYLARDSTMLNVPIGFDYARLLNYCCLSENEDGEEEICFKEKECNGLIEMFLARGRLHDRAYKHTKVKIIEEMILDAFVLANDRLKLMDTRITELTDHIYQKILYDDFGDDGKMKQAKAILKRIENRNLYKCIAKESFEGKVPDFNEILDALKEIPQLKPYLEYLMPCSVMLDMTKSNREKTLKNVLVYCEDDYGKIKRKKFDWDSYHDTLKLNMEELKRNQILILYKGETDFMLDLTYRVRCRLRRFLDARTTNS